MSFSRRTIIIGLLGFMVVTNEAYRFIEVRSLNSEECVYRQTRMLGADVSITPSTRAKSAIHVYLCGDGSTRKSVYRNDRYVRPWEKRLAFKEKH